VLLLGLSVLTARAGATVPGFPGEPQPPTIVYQGTCHTAAPLTCALETVKRGASATITILAKAKQTGQRPPPPPVTG